MTSCLQPCDAAIINSFKTYYKKRLLKWLLEQIEEFVSLRVPNLDEAIRMIRKAWSDVLPKTIVNCWYHCNILAMTDTVKKRLK